MVGAQHRRGRADADNVARQARGAQRRRGTDGRIAFGGCDRHHFGRIAGVVGMPRMGHDATQPQSGPGSNRLSECDDVVAGLQAAAVLATVNLDHERERGVVRAGEARGGRDHFG
jgi:hypothetical protein